MNLVYGAVAGIDVHKSMLAVVVAVVGAEETEYREHQCGTTTAQLEQLAQWLQDQQVSEVAMESTAQYWRPVWLALDGHALLELVERVLNANRDARGHPAAVAAKQAPERHSLLFRIQVPRGHFDNSLRHAMAADPRQGRRDLGGMFEPRPDDQWRKKLGEDVPDSLGRLAAVKRIAVGDRLAPPIGALAVDPRQHESAVVGAAEARLEESHERQAEQTDFESVDCHRRVAGLAVGPRESAWRRGAS